MGGGVSLRRIDSGRTGPGGGCLQTRTSCTVAAEEECRSCRWLSSESTLPLASLDRIRRADLTLPFVMSKEFVPVLGQNSEQGGVRLTEMGPLRIALIK